MLIFLLRYSYHGHSVKCRTIEENSNEVKFTLKFQILKKVFFDDLNIVFGDTSQIIDLIIVDIFFKVGEFRDIGALVLLIQVEQVLVLFLVLPFL